MTELARPDLHAAIEIRYPDNATERITPELLRDGLHEIVDSVLVKTSDGGAVPNVPLYKVGTDYAKDYTVRYPTGSGVEAFYYSLRTGKLPAPSGSSGDINWKVVPGPVSTVALSQQLTLREAQGIEGSQVVPGRTYLIDFGPDAAGYAQVVTVLGTAANLFAIRGQLTVNGVRSNVRVNVASGVFGQEVSNLLDTANAWKERQTFLKGLGLYNGYGFDEYAQLSIGQILLADKFLWRGNVQKMAQDVLTGWSPDDYAGQGHGLDAALGRVGAGTVEVNNGTKGQLGQLNVLDLFVGSVQNLALSTYSKLAAFVTNLSAAIAKKADLNPTTRKLVDSQAPGAEYPLYLENGQYKYDDAKLYLEVQAVGKRVNPLTGKLETDADYTTFAKVKVQPGVTYESVGLGIAYAAYLDVTNAWRQAWTLDSAGASSANASYNSRAFQTPNNGSVVEIYLWLSVRNDDVPFVRVRPTQRYNDAAVIARLGTTTAQDPAAPLSAVKAVLSQALTLAQAQSMVSASTLIPGRTYIVDFGADANGASQIVYASALQTNLFNRYVTVITGGVAITQALANFRNGVLEPAPTGGGGGGITPTQLETVRSTVSVATAISGDVTLSLAAAGGLLPVSTASTITVPTNATVAFVVGTVLELVPTTAAMPVVAAASGVTILAATGNKGAGQGCPLRLVQLAIDSWLLTGGA